MGFAKSALGALASSIALALAATQAAAGSFDWAPMRDESVVEVLTSDADGELRETPVWIVVLGDAAYVRTNDSKWLANIRRGSAVRLRVRDVETSVVAAETTDAALAARVEEAFQAKYGITQRVMSLFRLREPTVLALRPFDP